MTARQAASLGALLLALATGCSTYEVIEERPTNVAALTGASLLRARPLAFSFQPVPDWELSEEEWQGKLGDWRVAFCEELRNAAGAAGKRIEVVEEEVREGVVLETDVYDMARNWNAMTGGTDWVYATVRVADAASGETLYTARVGANSLRAGPAGWSFGGRIMHAVQNLAEAIGRLLERGTLARALRDDGHPPACRPTPAGA